MIYLPVNYAILAVEGKGRDKCFFRHLSKEQCVVSDRKDDKDVYFRLIEMSSIYSTET